MRDTKTSVRVDRDDLLARHEQVRRQEEVEAAHVYIDGGHSRERIVEPCGIGVSENRAEYAIGRLRHVRRCPVTLGDREVHIEGTVRELAAERSRLLEGILDSAFTAVIDCCTTTRRVGVRPGCSVVELVCIIPLYVASCGIFRLVLDYIGIISIDSIAATQRPTFCPSVRRSVLSSSLRSTLKPSK